MVLRLHAAHVKEIPAGLESQFRQRLGTCHPAHLRAVWNEDGLFAVAPAVVVLDGQRIGDHHRGAERGQPFGNQVPGLGEPVPLLAFALDAVHIQRHRHAEDSRPRGEDGVGAVAVERHVRAMPQQVQRRKEGMGESIEVLVADGGEILKPDAAIMRLREAARGNRPSPRGRAPPGGRTVLRQKSRIRRSWRVCRACRGGRSAWAAPGSARNACPHFTSSRWRSAKARGPSSWAPSCSPARTGTSSPCTRRPPAGATGSGGAWPAPVSGSSPDTRRP